MYESDAWCPGGEAYALTSDLVCRGSTRELPDNCVFPGVNQVVRLRDVRDGTSQTLLLGERPADPDAFWDWWAAGIGLDGHGLGDYVLDVKLPGDGLDWLHTSITPRRLSRQRARDCFGERNADAGGESTHASEHRSG